MFRLGCILCLLAVEFVVSPCIVMHESLFSFIFVVLFLVSSVFLPRSNWYSLSCIYILSRPFISSATESYSPAYGRHVRVRVGAGGVSSPLSSLPLCSRPSMLSLSRYACSSRFELASPVEASVARSRYKVGVALSPELR